jgi:hypothetical protein
MTKHTAVTLPNDVLWGVPAIARYLKREKHQVRYLIRRGALRVKKLGPRTIMARKSELDRDLSVMEEVEA